MMKKTHQAENRIFRNLKAERKAYLLLSQNAVRYSLFQITAENV